MANTNITELILSDTFADWFSATNTIIRNMNDMNINTAASGSGLISDIGTNGELFIALDLKTNSGLITDNSQLTISTSNLTDVVTVLTDDLFILDRGGSTTDTSDTNLKRVKATNILPLTVNGNHIFTNMSNYNESFISFEHENLFINSENIFVLNSYISLNYSLDEEGDFPNKSSVNSGFKIHTKTDLIKYYYDGSVNAWITNANFGFDTNSKFISTSDSNQAKYIFGLSGTQDDLSIRLQKTSANDDRYWEIYSDSYEDTLQFRMVDDTTGFENQDVIRLEKLAAGEGDGGLLYVNDKIYINNIFGSDQFKIAPAATFTSYIVPISTTEGILDYRWTNRFVTNQKQGLIYEGDVVSLTTDTNSVCIVQASTQTEETSNFIGIVERIYNGNYYVVLSGQFNASSSTFLSLSYGETYYLSATPGRLTLTPPSNIKKPVCIATGNKVGLLLSQSSGELPSFNNISVTNSLINEQFVFTPEIVNDTLSFRGGAGITLTHTTDDAILISASGGVGTQNTFSSVNEVAATGTNSNIQLTGMNGLGVEVSGTAGDEIEVELSIPNSFGIVQIVANTTDDHEFTISSVESNDNLQVFAGTGISITPHSTNGFIITATGTSVPAVDSVTNSILSQMPVHSIKASDSSGNPIDVSLNNFPLFYKDTNNNFYIKNSVNNTYYLAEGEGVNGDGTPAAIAGYVIGRILDEDGDVSSITSLNRSDLRLLLGASPTGYLEENQNAYTIIDVVHESTTTTLNASNTSDTLVFQSGSGISLTTENNTDGSSVIVISAASASYFSALGSGFTLVNLTNDSIVSGMTAGQLDIADSETIYADIGSNSSIIFNVNNSSINNVHLASMPSNSLKANVDSTDEGVVDLIIQDNSLVGRIGSGPLESLDVNQISTLLEDNFFTNVAIGKANGSVLHLYPDEDSGTLKLIEGSYITLTHSGDGELIISSSAPAAFGIKTIQTSDDSISRPASALVLDTPRQNYETLPGNIDSKPPSASGRQYSNISIKYIYDNYTKIYKAIFDMESMPASTVKCAGSDIGDSNNYVPTNVHLLENQILGRSAGNNYLTGMDITYYKNLIGINSYNKINITNEATDFADDYISTSQNNSALTLKGGSGISIIKEDASTLVIDSIFVTDLSQDNYPKLSGNLDINGKYFIKNNKRIALFDSESDSTDVPNPCKFYFNFDNTDVPTVRLLKDTTQVNNTNDSNIVLQTYGQGYFELYNGKIKSSDGSDFYIKSGSGIFNLDSEVNAGERTIYSAETINIHVATNKRINYSFSSTNDKDLTIEKINDEVLIYTSSDSNNQLVFLSDWNGYVSLGELSFRTNVFLDSDYCLTNADKLISIDGSLQITQDDTFGEGAGTSSVIIKKERVSADGNLEHISGIPVNALGVIYDILIVDDDNTNNTRMFTLKVFNNDANSNTAIVTYDERLSASAATNDDIKNLYFYKSANYLYLYNTSGANSIHHTVHSVMTIII